MLEASAAAEAASGARTCYSCKKYGVRRGKAAAQWILTQPAKSSLQASSLLPLLPLLLPTLLLLKPLLLLLTSQMATLGLTQRLRLLGLTSERLGLTSQGSLGNP